MEEEEKDGEPCKTKSPVTAVEKAGSWQLVFTSAICPRRSLLLIINSLLPKKGRRIYSQARKTRNDYRWRGIYEKAETGKRRGKDSMALYFCHIVFYLIVNCLEAPCGCERAG